jgi:hypothetical protein
MLDAGGHANSVATHTGRKRDDEIDLSKLTLLKEIIKRLRSQAVFQRKAMGSFIFSRLITLAGVSIVSSFLYSDSAFAGASGSSD